MKKINKIISLFSLCLLSTSLFAASGNSESPVGYWKTIDDKTEKPKSIVHLTQSSDRLLHGKVVKLFKAAIKTCAECKGSLKNKPILGMEVIGGLRQSMDDPTYWTGGQVLDPKNGKVYKCNLQVIENGRKIELRGYIGLPMFGRTQTWIRVGGPNSN